jgi:hypothetical protein
MNEIQLFHTMFVMVFIILVCVVYIAYGYWKMTRPNSFDMIAYEEIYNKFYFDERLIEKYGFNPVCYCAGQSELSQFEAGTVVNIIDIPCPGPYELKKSGKWVCIDGQHIGAVYSY